MTTQNVPIWLAGMPEYNLRFDERHVPSVPLGCRQHALDVFHNCGDESSLRGRLDAEYVAVLEALLDAGMPFRILNLSTAQSPLADRLRADGYPEFHIDVSGQGSTYTYPRDLMVYLNDYEIALVSDSWLKPGVADLGGVNCWPTCWSEGGRILMCDDTLVVFRHPEKKMARDQPTLNRLRERGLKVVEIPAGIFCTIDQEGATTNLFFDPHIDRLGGLLRGKDGQLHLIFGPGYRTGPLDNPLDAMESADLVHRIAEASGITLHLLPDGALPYGASLVQSTNGAVVVTGGDPSVAALLEILLGANNVVPTRTPITHFPIFASAGIHCLVTESPDFLLCPPRAKNC